MPLLISGEIFEAILAEVQGANTSVQVITAYLKKDAFVALNTVVSKEITDKRLLVRMRLDDILKGSSDFEAIEYALSNKWRVFLRFDLHAKTYVVDNKRCIVGSANMTTSGLSLFGRGNAETATMVEMDNTDISKIDRLYTGAIEVSEQLLADMRKEIDQADSQPQNSYQQWSSTITHLWKPDIQTLFSYEFPERGSYNVGEYVPFLDCYFESTTQVKQAFRWSNSYLWLEQLLKDNDSCLYFGAITSALHDTIVSDPKPYRKDVKELLSNLLEMIKNLQMDEITIDVPNHSQRVRLH